MTFAGCNYWENHGKEDEEPVGTAQSMHDCRVCAEEPWFNQCGMKRETETWVLNEAVRQQLNDECQKLDEVKQLLRNPVPTDLM